jgi:hypothetical protein
LVAVVVVVVLVVAAMLTGNTARAIGIAIACRVTSYILIHQARLADAAVAEDDDLEKDLLARGHRAGGACAQRAMSRKLNGRV